MVRLSFLLNVIVFIALVFMAQKEGPALVGKAGEALSAPFRNFSMPQLPPAPKPAAKPSAPAPAPAAVRKPVPAPPPAVSPVVKSGKPKIVIVLDDMGHTMNDRDILRALGSDVTYAILPHLKYSRYFGLLSKETGAEVILHQPFEATDGTIPGPGLITDRMPETQSLSVLRHSLESVPNHQGMNNHMGSRGTSDPELMAPILEELKRRNLFFLDSVTSSKSVAYSMARQMGLPALKRDVFLDNVDTPAAIRAQLQKLVKAARKQGYAVGIGHYHTNTLSVLRSDIPSIKEAGIEFVSLRELIQFIKSKGG